jgi:hypothetical protein
MKYKEIESLRKSKLFNEHSIKFQCFIKLKSYIKMQKSIKNKSNLIEQKNKLRILTKIFKEIQ